MAPSTPTAPQFPRLDPPSPSRSPSRSPRRKAQFAIRELDPLLGNLTPDSTLRALQATETISGGAAQEDALTSSIADATPAEREIGIRAAFAAQKLREWKNELSQWPWPGKQERGFGLGFVPPSHASRTREEYRGCLPGSVAEEYEARLEEIRDDLDSLGIDEIKDHVLEAHLPASSPTKTSRPVGPRSSYGRMRDFTALITATVIQALPDLAKLNMLVDTWDVRLRVLRDLPRFLDVMHSTKSDIQQAFNEIRTPDSAQALTGSTLDDKKVALGAQVADMGRRIDRFLDMLEGREDSLPQAWIDILEKIELDYATWVVEAEHVVLKNKLALKSSKGTGSESTVGSPEHPSSTHQENSVPEPALQPEVAQSPAATGALPEESIPEMPPSEKEEVKAKRRPSLKLDLGDQKGHKREFSKVSVADSMYSAFSDISNAEIMDARTTSVLPSPKISVVENPFPTSRDEIAWFGSPSAAQQQMALRPPMLQRASTASIEVFPKDKLKQVVLRRSASWDILTQMTQPLESTPSKALQQLTETDSMAEVHTAEVEVHEASSPPVAASTTSIPLPTPSFKVDPAGTQSSQEQSLPVLPRRSSKRSTTNGYSPVTPLTSGCTDENAEERPPDKLTAEMGQSPRRPRTRESLDDRIQDILTSLPTRIRLAKDADAQSSSTSSTRASTPTASLTLSPAKADPSSRRGSLADPDIKLYHLTRSGQGREAPPVKLFVRTVGDGDRVMVRVGGGWADLGEYLREYSLHHGSRATVDGRLEVASFPGNGLRDSVTSVSGTSVSQGRRKSRSPTVAQTTFEGAPSTDLINPKTRSSTQRRHSPERRKSRGDGTWTPPPVPPIPLSYTVSSPTLTTSADYDGGTVASFVDPDLALSKDQSQRTRQNPATMSQPRYSTIIGPGGVTTTTVVTPPTTTTNYTPLGAAGPKMNVRRAATYGITPAASNDAWVQGMVGKARAVSGGGGSPTIVQGPNGTTTTTTTTTTISSTPPSTSRRASSYLGSSPSSNANSSPVTISTSPSTSSIASDAKASRRTSLSVRSKGNRMSLGDIGGIKRVFLRKKSVAAKSQPL
ncbi:uncharacterized protein A1O5_00068 [Cladophialophora psammophila CBS 110553]|uniref:GAR domain-containing protein n=1 Tax=Cladophialophora psammophila CBS 110553 TaxID=1182543 RepID=W9X4X8_9EURO|nr:uncharacterized protein A1O5_00068 [Cladophialophora psammophila CBS 110553]EXJ75562.1 hypothetical protein A1O5_00068 [Cladophialophora psammophila CBS 110553]